MVKSNYYIWLQSALGAGAVTENMFSAFASAEEVFKAGERGLRLSGAFNSAQIDRLLRADINETYSVMESCASKGIDIITPESELYPKGLLQLRNYPLVLYAKGDISCLKDKIPLSLVGTRKAAPKSVAITTELSRALAKSGFVIVSGGALGIDSAAHTGALLAQGKTVAVLGCGIGCRYLMENEPLRRVISENGVLISELKPETPGYKGAFPMRNRIIAGISVGTVVIEAGKRSGSLITANYAAEQNRDLFAVPSDETGTTYLGVEELLKDGAKAVRKPWDVVEEYVIRYPDKIVIDESVNLMEDLTVKDRFEDYGYIVQEKKREVSDRQQKKKREITDPISDISKIVYTAFEDIPLTANEVTEKLDLPVNSVLGALTELEIFGYIEIYKNTKYRLT